MNPILIRSAAWPPEGSKAASAAATMPLGSPNLMTIPLGMLDKF
jgi:hypothetical protein